MPRVNVYLTFDGNCEEAMTFYEGVFGTKIDSLNRFADMPEGPDFTVLEAQKEKIMHASLPISEETAIMASDAYPGMGPPLTLGTNFSLSVHTDSREQSDEIFHALAEGGTITMPLADAFWNSYFGMVTDKFGIHWMVNFDTSAG